jgi:hypothetical protein
LITSSAIEGGEEVREVQIAKKGRGIACRQERKGVSCRQKGTDIASRQKKEAYQAYRR